ncbi:enoyl-CoA hydratase/isomerase family protein [Tsuneonella sp. CC-YZS046]|uniref:enoyl-CoA hydratase/isomerase family protein n=1 Tax=Tsuneonella sp. CC-YZS046 TaxID=3042152 RepID=UPI002D7846F2|nr:enoyl-CoA hydratase/isomerase family protein [Tsuneonella sp. CC-YZS046]WRO67251.1 enoyl-CoA hydratase/isomerase family protein [Tsuneonella sp. CC-YZS046]
MVITYQFLRFEQRGEIGIVTLDRPDRLNALNPGLMEELAACFTALRGRHDVRVVLLRGEGRAFCAGADLNSDAMVPDGPGRAQKQVRIQKIASGIVAAMRDCPQPIIALLKGPVCGGGFSIALAADVRLATPDTRMNVANLKVGLGGPDMGSGYMLPRLIGWSAAAALMFTGDFIQAERACQLGLVAEIADPDELDRVGEEWAGRMLAASPMGLRLTKESLNQLVDCNGLAAALAMEDIQQTLLLGTADHREAVSAFLEKRKPDYRDE